MSDVIADFVRLLLETDWPMGGGQSIRIVQADVSSGSRRAFLSGCNGAYGCSSQHHGLSPRLLRNQSRGVPFVRATPAPGVSRPWSWYSTLTVRAASRPLTLPLPTNATDFRNLGARFPREPTCQSSTA